MRREYIIRIVEGTTYYNAHFDGRLAKNEEYRDDDFFRSILMNHKSLLSKLNSRNLETRVEIK